jgi:hypothetical protein
MIRFSESKEDRKLRIARGSEAFSGVQDREDLGSEERARLGSHYRGTLLTRECPPS